MKKRNITILTILLTAFLFLSMTGIRSYQQDTWEVPEEYQNMVNPYADTPDYDRIGRSAYAKYCKSCHGKTGKGDGVNSKLLTVPVADFTDDSFKAQSDGSLYYKIYSGRSEMPGFAPIIPEEEDLWMVVNFVRNL